MQPIGSATQPALCPVPAVAPQGDLGSIEQQLLVHRGPLAWGKRLAFVNLRAGRGLMGPRRLPLSGGFALGFAIAFELVVGNRDIGVVHMPATEAVKRVVSAG